MVPVNALAAARACSRVTAPMSHRPVTSPLASSVVVDTPSTTSVRYDLGNPDRKRRSRVTVPSPTSSTPVASGSKVPAWPTLRSPNTLRHRATTS